MFILLQILVLILALSPGFGAIAFTVTIIRAILRGEITTATGGRSSPKVSRTYKAGTFSFWVQIAGFLLFILFFALIQFLCLPVVMKITGYAPAWLAHLYGLQIREN